jgi:bacillithiol system protein YtxJ
MFRWLTKDREGAGVRAIPEIDAHTDLDTLFHSDALILFKHSTACAVSWAAHNQVTRFRERYPEVPVYLVPVLKQREISHAIARRTGVRHESPQIIFMRRGAVAEAASHGAITESRLAQMLSEVACN